MRAPVRIAALVCLGAAIGAYAQTGMQHDEGRQGPGMQQHRGMQHGADQHRNEGMQHGAGQHRNEGMQRGAGQHHEGMQHGRGVPQSQHGASMARHQFVHRQGIDAQYADKVSPLEPTAADLANGRTLYERNCALCHGATGAGDGDAGIALNPPPSNLAWTSRMPIATDAYLLWTIAEGGAPVGSAMPPFKAALDATEIWQVIAYLRTL